MHVLTLLFLQKAHFWQHWWIDSVWLSWLWNLIYSPTIEKKYNTDCSVIVEYRQISLIYSKVLGNPLVLLIANPIINCCGFHSIWFIYKNKLNITSKELVIFKLVSNIDDIQLWWNFCWNENRSNEIIHFQHSI